MKSINDRLLQAGRAYFVALVILTLLVAAASFLRERAQLLTDISFWYFCITFLVSAVSLRVGLPFSVLLLTVSPSLHHQLNLLTGSSLNAWAFAGVDCLLGFVSAWLIRGGLREAVPLLRSYPVNLVLPLHLWVAMSSLVAVGRNLWQSASEFTFRGLAYNVWITRGLSVHDDYYPLQDLFFIGVGVMVLFSTWTQLKQWGSPLVRSIVTSVVIGAMFNTAFAMWQRTSGRGWFAGNLGDSNAMWPDIHSAAGLMVIAIFLGIAELALRRDSGGRRAFLAAGIIVSSVGLYSSGSRSTLLIVVLLLITVGCWVAAFRLRGQRRVLALIGMVGVVGAITLALDAGYRGVNLEMLRAAIESSDPETLNAAVSYRPEIWHSALKMYWQFPIFGLGQGTFHRLSSIADFAQSSVLAGMGGAAAHNYLLHSWIELGAIGLLLMTLVALPFLRLGRSNFRSIGFFGLVAVALGNVYGHSLLVREMLVLAAAIGGIYVWEIYEIAGARLQVPPARTSRFLMVAFLALLLTSGVEAWSSLQRSPFTFGKRCFETHPKDADGWTRGVSSLPIPAGATQATLTIEPPPPALSRRPIEVEIIIVWASGQRNVVERLTFDDSYYKTRRLGLPIGSDGGTRQLEIRTSRCFVPLNRGYALDGKHDTRRLGVKVSELSFAAR